MEELLKDLCDCRLTQKQMSFELDISMRHLASLLKEFGLQSSGFRRSQPMLVCLNCNSTFKGSETRKYCSRKCCYEKTIKSGFDKISSSGIASSARIAKKFIISKTGNVCDMCKTSTWLGKPILLILDHINGNPEDMSITNLRLLCSNCDAVSPYYKGRNKGRGRFSRRQRYLEGKSY